MYRIIVIEDETTVRRGIVLTINWEAMDCAIVGEAANGEDGLKLALRLVPDIIITDVKMPRMDGVEMISRLRTAGCRSRFIILTAYSDFKYAQSALRLSVSDYLLKPLKDGELEAAVRHILDLLADPAGGVSAGPDTSLWPDTNNQPFSKYVKDALHFIHHHYSEDINISTVAGVLGISEGYLSRIFKKETDYTFTNYLIYYRTKLAIKLLKDHRLKVYEVAYQVGYSDTAYFSAQFKKITGISPSEYQERC